LLVTHLKIAFLRALALQQNLRARASILFRDQERRNEDGEQENELNECECDKHNSLQSADRFRLASHALQSSVSDQS
jgi:hypothetical protein